MDVHSLLQSLASKRAMFHSEADFQHALAWELRVLNPTTSPRLEIAINGMHLDLLVRNDAGAVAFELKYKTRRASLSSNGELFALNNHSAQDIGRYDFLKDVSRLEQMVALNANWQGWAILLSNDPGYWRPSRGNTVDSQFKINEGRILGGTLYWDARASAGTTAGRTSPINLRGRYETRWHLYLNTSGREFRYVALHVTASKQET